MGGGGGQGEQNRGRGEGFYMDFAELKPEGVGKERRVRGVKGGENGMGTRGA